MSVAIRAVKFGTSDGPGSVPALASLSKEVLVRSLVDKMADFDDRVIWNSPEMLSLKSSLKNLPPNISEEMFKSIFVNKAKSRSSVSVLISLLNVLTLSNIVWLRNIDLVKICSEVRRGYGGHEFYSLRIPGYF